MIVGTGLSYTVGQVVIVANTSSNYMVGSVTSYNSGTGQLVINVTNISGSGTYNSWSVNLNGLTGPQGPQGPTGPQGPQGPQGSAGPQGPIGPIGNAGPAGAAGPQGPQGPIGNAGPQGPQGQQGPQGPIGSGGPAGSAGPQGPQGPTGPQGPQGPIGPYGVQGPQGPTGPQGPQGASGSAGASGPTGPQGPTGPNTSIYATNNTATTVLYPVMVGAAGASQTPNVTTSKFSFDASSGNLTVTNVSVGNANITTSLSVGTGTGGTLTGLDSVSSNNAIISGNTFSGNYYFTGGNPVPNIAVATDDTATNSTFYPMFISAAASAQNVKVSTTKLTFNPSTGNLTVSGSFVGTATSAKYADLAEAYISDATYEPGTVIDFGGEHEVTMANTIMSTKVAGVVSQQPAYLMNSELQAQHVTVVALQGRVPTKVIGPVGKGDMLITGPSGHAMACSSPVIGSVVGKSLENFTATPDNPTTVIEVVVGKV